MNKKLSHFVYGTQYYRAPTPLPEEWEEDFQNLEKVGLDTVQLRVQWRKNERIENEYDFSDIDKLFELAEKYRKKVIFKFLLENAPDYIYKKYDGYRRDMLGEIIPPTASGAFYIGGWLPCFDNPDVIAKSRKFVNIFVERYKNHPNLMLWNIWNEPRSRPIGQCGCQHSVKLYQVWLQNRYGTIEKLNEVTGKGWESFESIVPPSGNRDYIRLYLWRQWTTDAIATQLKEIYDEVKMADPNRQVICHVGCCTVIQDTAADASDDIKNAGTVDFYGTSLPTAHHFKSIIDEAKPFMICDWIRSVSPYFWVNELYSDWGNWDYRISTEDFRFKVMAALACGAKGLVYWQYRAERVGSENDLSGLVNIDGSFKNVSYESEKIAQFTRGNEEFLVNAKPVRSSIGILYSRQSDLINRVENTGGKNGPFEIREFPYLYKKAFAGAYAALRELGYAPVIVDTGQLEKALSELQLLYIPEAFIITTEQFALIKTFIGNGGKVIAEEGFALRNSCNTWLHPRWPGLGADELFGAYIEERISDFYSQGESLNLFGNEIPMAGYASFLSPIGKSEVIGKWQNGRSGAIINDNSCYLGTSLGAVFFDNADETREKTLKILKMLFKKLNVNIHLPRLPEKVYQRELTDGHSSMLFLFNRSNSIQQIETNGTQVEIQPSDSIAIKQNSEEKENEE